MLMLGALMLALTPSRTLVGNFLDTSPNGIAIVWGPKAAALVDFGGDYMAGIAAPDDSYHEQDLTFEGRPVTLEWSRIGDGAVGRLVSTSGADMIIKLAPSWPHVTTIYDPTATGCVARSGDHSAAFVMDPAPASGDLHTLTLNLKPGQAVHFSFGLDQPEGGAEIDKTLESTRANYLTRMPASTGDWGDFIGTIPRNMNNSRNYASDEDWVAHSVSRGWAGGKADNEPYFCWDSFFTGALSTLDDPVTARATVRAILSWETPEGNVPNYGHWDQSDGSRSSVDRSQPPVGSLCIWKMQQRWPDVAFLKEVYPKLLKWHRWWPKYRDGDHDGLLEWGSDGVGKQGALWETGWDDTPQYADSEMVGTHLDTDAVDLNALWSMDAENLAYIADAVGDHATGTELRAEHEHTNQLINQRLWNPELGIYCSRKWDSKGGAFLTRLTPMNFYPLICGAPSLEQAKSVLAVMTDPKQFWGQWILPTVSMQDPVWPQQGYWHGTIWGPVNFLVFQGVRRYATLDTQAEYAKRSVALFMKNWAEHGWCGENFRSDSGVVLGDKHYTWGDLLCLVGLENVCSIELDGRITLNGDQKASLTMRNIPIHGKRYTVETGPGWARLVRNGRTVFEAHGDRVTRAI